jgi:hypothetical protein
VRMREDFPLSRVYILSFQSLKRCKKYRYDDYSIYTLAKKDYELSRKLYIAVFYHRRVDTNLPDNLSSGVQKQHAVSK